MSVVLRLASISSDSLNRLPVGMIDSPGSSVGRMMLSSEIELSSSASNSPRSSLRPSALGKAALGIVSINQKNRSVAIKAECLREVDGSKSLSGTGGGGAGDHDNICARLRQLAKGIH